MNWICEFRLCAMFRQRQFLGPGSLRKKWRLRADWPHCPSCGRHTLQPDPNGAVSNGV